MLSTSKIKWFGSIALAGTLLVLALLGGKWGTTYSASANVNAAPIITSIDPSLVPAGSPDQVVIIIGANFGDATDTRVRLTGGGVDLLLEPLQILPDGISVVISDTLLAEPTLYTITVVKSIPQSIPKLPITPWDEESNPASFFVYGASYIHLPIITNNATH